jgi:hypothetical protein
MQHSWDAMRREPGVVVVEEKQHGVATHVRTPGYSCTSPSRLRIPDRKLASSHRQHETTCRSSVPSCLDSLPVCLPALCHPCCREACALFQRPLSRPRARAARSHLGSSWHTTSVPIRAMQTDCAIRCIMFMLLSDCPETLHMPVALSPSLLSPSLAHSPTA